MMASKMKIEIWSDVMCPFCYIGKRRFEKALAQFPHKDEIEVEWKSYQLNPGIQTDPSLSLNQMLADSKGISPEQAQEMNHYVVEMAKDAGLEYNLESAIPANTFKAHRFLHFAKRQGVQDEAEEALFKAYFTESRNVDDEQTLVEIGRSLRLDPSEIQLVLEENRFAEDVYKDQYEAQQVGVRGVPFFVFDGQAAISGAQATEVFAQALEQTFKNWQTGVEG